MTVNIHDEIAKLGELIEQSQKILLINHIRMDGDAWGSLGGLALVLEDMGKTIRGINDSNVPACFDFLGRQEIINPELDIEEFNPDIIISLDSSDTGRLGETYITWKEEFTKRPLIVIDHHISNPYFGDINIIDPEASSVCELLTHVLYELELQTHITPEAASFLYTGLQTDSNMYFNTNTRAQTLEAGAKLMRLGADFRTPIMMLYKKRTQNQLKFWSFAISKLEYNCENSVCSCIMSDEDVQLLDIPRDELSGYFKSFISEIMINIEAVDIAFFIYGLSQKENKVSMRSQQGFNIAEICEIFGGGGHKQAAGFQSESTKETIKNEIMQEIFNKFGKQY